MQLIPVEPNAHYATLTVTGYRLRVPVVNGQMTEHEEDAAVAVLSVEELAFS
jgi:hypothetical protein